MKREPEMDMEEICKQPGLSCGPNRQDWVTNFAGRLQIQVGGPKWHVHIVGHLLFWG